MRGAFLPDPPRFPVARFALALAAGVVVLSGFLLACGGAAIALAFAVGAI